ncbi:MAG: hypothetical protein Aurels2KO_34570 [Aureliella sp.]
MGLVSIAGVVKVLHMCRHVKTLLGIRYTQLQLNTIAEHKLCDMDTAHRIRFDGRIADNLLSIAIWELLII